MERCCTIEALISGYYEREFSLVEGFAEPHFSLTHKRRMKKIFAIFRKNSEKTSAMFKKAFTKPLGIKKRIVLTALILILMAFLLGAISIQFSNGFSLTKKDVGISLKATNMDTAPEFVERYNVLEIIPEGFRKETIQSDSYRVNIEYHNDERGAFFFEQSAKRAFIPVVFADYDDFQKTEINGYDALYLTSLKKENPRSLVIWDSGDYIYSLGGKGLSCAELLELANNNQKIWNMKNGEISKKLTD